MLSKLATLALKQRHHPTDRLMRDEIAQVIIDTETLVTSEDPKATLDRWLEDA